MKTLFFSLVLFLGFVLNTTAQKIDPNCTPQLPDKSWSVDPKSTFSEIDFSKITLKLIPIPEGTNMTSACEKEAKTGISACVLDYLLENPELIPTEWKGKSVAFTGTIFKDRDGNALYKTLIYQDGKWGWGKNYLEYMLEKTYKVTTSQSLSYNSSPQGELFSITKIQLSSIIGL